MSVRHGLLALLGWGPAHGYQLRVDFEAATAGTWPLNVGQVYTTLTRLERDGLVAAAGTPDDEGRVDYRLTDDGAAEVRRWFDRPVARDGPARDEVGLKLALAARTPDVDVVAVVQEQRRAEVERLQALTRLKRQEPPEADLAWSLLLDGLVFQTEATVRWLDHCETRLAVAARRPPPASSLDAHDRAERDAEPAP